MIELTALPLSPAIAPMRPAGLALSTTSDFALALADLAGGAAVPAVSDAGVPKVLTGTMAGQIPAAPGNILPDATVQPPATIPAVPHQAQAPVADSPPTSAVDVRSLRVVAQPHATMIATPLPVVAAPVTVATPIPTPAAGAEVIDGAPSPAEDIASTPLETPKPVRTRTRRAEQPVATPVLDVPVPAVDTLPVSTDERPATDASPDDTASADRRDPADPGPATAALPTGLSVPEPVAPVVPDGPTASKGRSATGTPVAPIAVADLPAAPATHVSTAPARRLRTEPASIDAVSTDPAPAVAASRAPISADTLAAVPTRPTADATTVPARPAFVPGNNATPVAPNTPEPAAVAPNGPAVVAQRIATATRSAPARPLKSTPAGADTPSRGRPAAADAPDPIERAATTVATAITTAARTETAPVPMTGFVAANPIEAPIPFDATATIDAPPAPVDPTPSPKPVSDTGIAPVVPVSVTPSDSAPAARVAPPIVGASGIDQAVASRFAARAPIAKPDRAVTTQPVVPAVDRPATIAVAPPAQPVTTVAGRPLAAAVEPAALLVTAPAAASMTAAVAVPPAAIAPTSGASPSAPVAIEARADSVRRAATPSSAPASALPQRDIQPAARMFAQAMFAAAPAAERDEAPSDALPLALLTGTGPTAPTTTPIAVHAASAADRSALDLTRADWMTSMIDRIETIRDESGGVAETRMKLAPDALGNVEVALRRDDAGQIRVEITADTAQARTILNDAAPRLADMAEARGLKLGGSGVDAGGSFADSGRRDAQQAPTATPRRPASAANDAGTPATPTKDTRLA